MLEVAVSCNVMLPIGSASDIGTACSEQLSHCEVPLFSYLLERSTSVQMTQHRVDVRRTGDQESKQSLVSDDVLILP